MYTSSYGIKIYFLYVLVLPSQSDFTATRFAIDVCNEYMKVTLKYGMTFKF